MDNNKKLVILFAITQLLVVGCGAGSSSNGTSSTDSQTVTYNSYILGNNPNTSTLYETFTATGCKNITASGTCSIYVTYRLVGSYPNPVSLSLVTTTGGSFNTDYSNDSASCTPAPIDGTEQSCTITITNQNTSTVANSEPVRVAPQGAGNFTSTSSSTYIVVGGGL